MFRIALLITLLYGLFAVPAAAQESCDVSTIVDSVASAKDLDTLRAALIAALQQVNDCTPADVGTTRSNPVLFGAAFTFSEGTLSLDAVELTTPDGYDGDYLRITLRWTCQQVDDNTTCEGYKLSSDYAYVALAGTVASKASVYSEDAITVDGHEVYSGAELVANVYFEALPTDGLLRLELDGVPVFFALE